ncbi:MAG: stage sporulation protein [Pelosinus sp.]|jgi:stage II sporulation protein M|nr:stage sporulation protein [Pelosinus sp.]
MLGYLRQNFGVYLKANIVAYFFMILIFVIGIVVGALAVKILPDEQKSELINYLHIFFTGLSQGNEDAVSSGNMIGMVMFNNIKTVVIMWILGFTIIGIPFVLFILFTRGFIIGFTVGFLINEYVMRGLLFAIASVLPHNLFAVPVILVLGVSATTFSLMLVRRKTYSKINIWYEAMRYTMVCMILLIIMLFAALLEVYISPVFMKLAATLLTKQ